MVINNKKDKEIVLIKEVTTETIKDKTLTEMIVATTETKIEIEIMGIMAQIVRITQLEVEIREVGLFRNLSSFLWEVYLNLWTRKMYVTFLIIKEFSM